MAVPQRIGHTVAKERAIRQGGIGVEPAEHDTVRLTPEQTGHTLQNCAQAPHLLWRGTTIERTNQNRINNAVHVPIAGASRRKQRFRLRIKVIEKIRICL